jgi:hypothetical protein
MSLCDNHSDARRRIPLRLGYGCRYAGRRSGMDGWEVILPFGRCEVPPGVAGTIPSDRLPTTSRDIAFSEWEHRTSTWL